MMSLWLLKSSPMRSELKRTHSNSELTKNSNSRKLYAILKLSYHKKS